jgi:hypothetical protein
VTATQGGFGGTGYGGGYGPSRFDEMTHFGSSYNTPGWQRGAEQTRRSPRRHADDAPRDDADDVATRVRPGGRRGDMGRFARSATATLTIGASWSPSRPAPFPPSRSGTASFTRNSAMATWWRSTATSSPLPSTNRRSAWWMVVEQV